VTFVVSCSGATEQNVEQTAQAESVCSADEQLSTFCGFQNPEDLDLLPGGEALIATGFGGLPPAIPGTMYVVNVDDGSSYVPSITFEENTWGDTACLRDSEEISPHGLSLVRREDGALSLAITNHLPRETIELFEMTQDQGVWSLTWRGCVDAAPNTLFNDVALLADGSFYATSMYNADLSQEALFEAGFATADTGEVWHWQSQVGYSSLENTTGSFPNGIALSEDGNSLYINYWFSGTTVKYHLASRSTVASHSAGGADNLTVVGGEVFVATHDITLADLERCGPEVVMCTLPFTIHVLSANDLSPLRAYAYTGEMFGVATVAIPHGDNLWLGTFHGDRVARLSTQ
jgi:sugar lactone lactonase YvrE